MVPSPGTLVPVSRIGGSHRPERWCKTVRNIHLDSIELDGIPVTNMIFADHFDTLQQPPWLVQQQSNTQGATADASNSLLIPTSFGSGSSYHGPQVVRTFSPLSDFDITCSGINIPYLSGGMGLVRIQLWSADNTTECYEWFYQDDWCNDYSDYLINNTFVNGGYAVATENVLGFNGAIRFNRIGSMIYLYRNGTLVYQGDTNTTPIGKVSILFEAYAGYTPPTMSIDRIELKGIPVMNTIFADHFDTLQQPPWSVQQQPNTQGATADASNSLLIPTSFGSGSSYHGPQVVRTFSPLSDFDITCSGINIPYLSGGMGLVRIQLWSADNTTECYEWFYQDDWSNNYSDSLINDTFINGGYAVATENVLGFNGTIRFNRVGSTIYLYRNGTLVYQGNTSTTSIGKVSILFIAYASYAHPTMSLDRIEVDGI